MAEEKAENQEASTEEEEHECPECPPKGARLGWQPLQIWQPY